MHVMPPLPSPAIYSPIASFGNVAVPSMVDAEMMNKIQKLASQEEEQGKALLTRTAQRLRQRGIKVRTILSRGDSATEIISYAKKHHIDLVVAGSRGLSSVKSWLLGSVSRKLVHYAPCSVLIVKGNP